MDTPFIAPEDCNNAQLVFQTLIYSVILYQASNLISDGSEFLLLVPSLAGLVGSIVLPILGAVPDGMMTLCSGLGPDAQNQVSAGVGVLAGSTVMLLTFPWFIAIIYGKVPLASDGSADYKKKSIKIGSFSGGVSLEPSIPKNAKVMLLTTLLYLIIQVPASSLKAGLSLEERADAVSQASFIGMWLCLITFCIYLYICYTDSKASEDLQLDKIIEGIKDKHISMSSALAFVKTSAQAHGGLSKSGTSADLLDKDRKALVRVLKPFFKVYDKNGDQMLSRVEFGLLLDDLGENVTAANKDALFRKSDSSNDGQINFEEFVDTIYAYMADDSRSGALESAVPITEDGDDDEEEEAEIPEDLAMLDKSEQQRRIIFRACYMMFFGTALVLVFSDPLVDNLSDLGKRMGVSPFYVAFILAPFASNASELLSAYNYAVKKTSKSMCTSLSTLIGAACMNNTFCLGIFFALIYYKRLAWTFTAEVIAIMLSQWIIALLAIFKKTHTICDAMLILGCYPFCLFVVWACENLLGME